MIHTKIKVQGMHCKSCEIILKEEIEEIEGVELVHANHNENNIEIDYKIEEVSLERIKETISTEGYEVM